MAQESSGPSLEPGARLGVYEILGKLGAGGMGQVYRARDSRLGRNVAIKTSLTQFSTGFAREARLVASLNHPNICTLHDVGPDYLVMELVDGEAPRGPLAVKTVVGYARQIAAALDAAHQKGIVHRDLKPANIKVTPQGLVKVLDFGLAKTVGASVTTPLDPGGYTTESGIGTVVGTPAYMSPEQAAGRSVDKRTDIWAFGVIMYELFAGKRPFRGNSVNEVIGSILHEAPDLSVVPVEARPLLRRCLEKDPDRRLRDIGDAMAWLEEAPEAAAPMPSRARWVWPAIAGLIALAAVVVTVIISQRRSDPSIAATFQVPPPPDTMLWSHVAVSPDGRRVVFTAQDLSGRMRLWLRDLDGLSAKPLQGTDFASADAVTPGSHGSPFWSPDSLSIAFSDGDTLKRIEASGTESPVEITKVPGVAIGHGTWSTTGTILFTDRAFFRWSEKESKPEVAIWRVKASGGEATPIVSVANRMFGLPTFLPDGRRFLFIETTPKGYDVYAGSLDTPADRQATTRIMQSGSQVLYAAPYGSDSGRAVFVQQDTLLSQPFDADTMTLSGTASPLAPRISIAPRPGPASFSLSQNGVLVFRQAGSLRLTWFDRRGQVIGAVQDPEVFGAVRISPDGTRAALDYNGQVWLIDFKRNNMRTLLTRGSDRSDLPFWRFDSTQIVFRSWRANEFGFYIMSADGTGQERLIHKSKEEFWIDDWSPDGRFVLFSELSPSGDSNISLIPIEGGERVSVLSTPADEQLAQLSPSGRLLAYTSDSTGLTEVYVRSFSMSAGRPVLGPEYRVSTGGGKRPLWRGRELWFIGGTGRTLMAATVQDTAPYVNTPAVVCPLRFIGPWRGFDVDPSGLRVLARAPIEDPNLITIMTNWRR